MGRLLAGVVAWRAKPNAAQPGERIEPQAPGSSLDEPLQDAPSWGGGQGLMLTDCLCGVVAPIKPLS